MKLKKTKKETIEDLKQIRDLFYQSQLLQNKAKVILNKHFDIKDYEIYKNNEFYKIWNIETFLNLYSCEELTKQLIKKLLKNEK